LMNANLLCGLLLIWGKEMFLESDNVL